MAGGLFQLIGYGAQDHYVTGNHTPFSNHYPFRRRRNERILPNEIQDEIRGHYVKEKLRILYQLRDHLLNGEEVLGELVVDMILEYLADEWDILDEWTESFNGN